MEVGEPRFCMGNGTIFLAITLDDWPSAPAPYYPIGFLFFGSYYDLRFGG